MPATETTYQVALENQPATEAALVALVKRATRRGIPSLLTWTWGAPYGQGQGVKIPLVVTGERPHHAGWRFIATLQQIEDEHILRALPGEQVPARYRTSGAQCEHCATSRRRKDTYVLAHEDGRHVQVGSSCLRDFLGSDEVVKLAAAAEAFAALDEIAEISDGSGSGSYGRSYYLVHFVALTAHVIEEHGWLSRTKARESHDRSTADRVCALLARKGEPPPRPTDAQIADARAAVQWAADLSDAEVRDSDYLHNLRVIAYSGLVASRTEGLAASILPAWRRAQDRLRDLKVRASRPPSRYLGTPGDKFTIGLPAQLGKRGKPLKNAPRVLGLEPATMDFFTTFETDYGMCAVVRVVTDAGEVLVWKTSSPGVCAADVGKRCTVQGTIKAHREYKGVQQTEITRAQIDLI